MNGEQDYQNVHLKHRSKQNKNILFVSSAVHAAGPESRAELYHQPGVGHLGSGCPRCVVFCHRRDERHRRTSCQLLHHRRQLCPRQSVVWNAVHWPSGCQWTPVQQYSKRLFRYSYRCASLFWHPLVFSKIAINKAEVWGDKDR